MNEQKPPLETGIPDADWEQTPVSVRVAFQVLDQQVQDLKTEVARLQEQLNLNSSNSSKPPSSDRPETKIVKGKPTRLRQLCWAHLLRDFLRIVERGSQSALVGEPLRCLAGELLLLWARVRDGTQSDAGSRFVERIPPVVVTCRQQACNPLDYLRQAVSAHRQGYAAPSLLPDH